MTIDDIQQKLKQESLDAYIIGYENRFLGQDILPQEHKIKYLCGFSGSAGWLSASRTSKILLAQVSAFWNSVTTPLISLNGFAYWLA